MWYRDGRDDSRNGVIDWEACDYGQATAPTAGWPSTRRVQDAFRTTPRVETCAARMIPSPSTALQADLLRVTTPRCGSQQPLKSFEFNSDYSRFEMETRTASVSRYRASRTRTWLMLEGELVDMVRVVTPECLCD